jgi:tetratricopeptide (TPR) repeat protein
VAGKDTALLWTLAELELRAGNADAGLSILQGILTAEPAQRDQLVLLGCSVADVSIEVGYRVIDLGATIAIANGEWAAAAAALNEFVNREPGYIPALMRLVEVCVDGGLEATMYSAQGQLTDAYLAAGRGAEARVIAEDLVAREPWDRSNIERFRQALSLLGEADVDAVIAERLSGQTPFVSTDLYPALEEDRFPGATASTSGVFPAPVPAEASAPPEPAESAELASQGREDEVFDLGTEALDVTFLEESAAPAAAPAAPGQASEDVEIDLSNVLEELRPSMADGKSGDTGTARDSGGVFKDFRDEVSREHMTETAAQHYKLAVAYHDMGMMDDAVSALEVAVRAPRFKFEAGLMLAHVYLKRGMPEQAIEWFERAAEAPAPSPDAGRALLYELADTLEAQGETARALAVFIELQSDAGEYRDLSVRLERLTKVQLPR